MLLPFAVGRAILPAAAFSGGSFGPTADPWRRRAPVESRRQPGLAAPLILLLLAAATHAQTGATVEGKVVSASDGAPVRKATVLLQAPGSRGDSAPPNRESYLTETDASGRFAVTGVAPGAYECVPSRVGFAARPPNRSGAAFVLPQINVAEGQHISGLALRLTPLGVVSGRVVDPEGAPVSNASVDALQYAYSAEGKTLAIRLGTTSDDRGQFRLFDLYPGAYYLRATPQMDSIESATTSFGPTGVQRSYYQMSRNPVRGPSLPALIMTYYPSVTDSAKASLVEVPAGGEAGPAEIRVQRQALYAIRGRLPAGLTSLPLTIDTRPSDPNFRFLGGMKQRDGNFEITGLPPGSYVLIEVQRNRSDAGAFLYARVFVDVTDHDVEGLELGFAPSLQISGVVKAAGKTAVALGSLTVTLRGVDGGRFNGSAPVKADGSFSIGLLVADVYRVSLGPTDVNSRRSGRARAYVTSAKLGDTELSDRELDLRRGASEPLTLTVSADMGRIDGKATDDDGQPAAAAYVTLVPDQAKWDWPERYLEDNTDSQGRFVFDGLVPGRYTLFAWQDVPHGAPQDADFRKPFEKLGIAIDVEPGGRQTLELKAIGKQP